jgi:hypothetical protein
MAVEITRTPSSNGNQKTWTFSVWLKGQDVTSGTAQNILSAFYGSSSRYANINITSTYTLEVFSGVYSTGGSTTTSAYLVTNRVFRDPSAWWNIVVAYDTTNATSGDRVKIYINGVRETSFSTETYPSLNDDSFFNVTTTQNRIGASGGANVYKGLMTHMHFIDGTAYDASTFGETDATTGIWKPKTAPSVTYGTNGCFLKFQNSADMDFDSSPNNLTFSTSGTLTQTVDTPSNVFATFNPLIYMPNIPTFENGNLYVKGHDANYCEAISTLSMPKSGKWYAEFKKIEINNCFMVGIGNTNNIVEALRTNTNISPSGGGYSGGAVTIREAGDVRQTNVSDISGFFPSSIANTNIIGLAIDLDNGAVYAHKNGTYGVISSVTGDPTSGASKTGAIDISGQAWYQNADFICFLFGNTSGATKDWCQANFGNGYFGTTAVASAGSNGNGAIFEYDVPTGYYALNTKNINTYG